jgi:hypothetical protein
MSSKILKCVETPDPWDQPPRKRRIKLRDAKDAVRFLGRIINALVNEQIDVDRGRAIIYGCSVLAKMHETTVLEGRLLAIEEQLKTGGLR